MNPENFEARLTRLETLSENWAQQGWVKDLVQPIQESVIRMEHAVNTLTDDSKMLVRAHEELLKDRAERERRLYEEQLRQARDRTFGNLLRENVAPILGVVLSTAAIIALLGEILKFWLVNYAHLAAQ